MNSPVHSPEFLRFDRLLLSTRILRALPALVSTGVLAASAAPQTAPAPKAAGGDGYRLTQQSKFFGMSTVYLTNAAMRVYDLKSGMNIVSKAPDWKVVMFNEKAKTRYETPLRDARCYMTKTLMVFMGRDFTKFPLNKKGTVQFRGLEAHKFASPHNFAEQQMKARQSGTVAATTVRSVDFTAAELKPLPAQEGTLLSKIYGIPDTQMIPLQCVFTYVDNDLKTVLNTVRMERLKVPASTFEVPKGYKLVKTETEVRLSDKVDNGLLDIMTNGKD